MNDVSVLAKQVICLCLDPIQERRPTAAQLLKHPWFEGLSTKSPVVKDIKIPSSVNTKLLSDKVRQARSENQHICGAAQVAIIEAMAMLSDVDNVDLNKNTDSSTSQVGSPYESRYRERKNVIDDRVLNDFKVPKPVPQVVKGEVGLFEGLLEMANSIDLRY
jgi:serine/threonine protein kinase